MFICWGTLSVWSSRSRVDPHLHGLVLLVHRAASAGRGLRLGQGIVVLGLRAVEVLLKDGLGLVELELGLEVVEVGIAAAVGSASLIGEAEAAVDNFLTGTTPADESAQPVHQAIPERVASPRLMMTCTHS